MAPVGTNPVENLPFMGDVLQSIFVAAEESSRGHPQDELIPEVPLWHSV